MNGTWHFLLASSQSLSEVYPTESVIIPDFLVWKSGELSIGQAILRESTEGIRVEIFFFTANVTK